MSGDELLAEAFARDCEGREAEAIPLYMKALEAGLSENLECEALLCLGSSYRVVGRLPESETTLRRAIERFPNEQSLKPFLALTLHQSGKSADAVSELVQSLVRTTGDRSITRYSRALLSYADDLVAESCRGDG